MRDQSRSGMDIRHAASVGGSRVARRYPVLVGIGRAVRIGFTVVVGRCTRAPRSCRFPVPRAATGAGLVRFADDSRVARPVARPF